MSKKTVDKLIAEMAELLDNPGADRQVLLHRFVTAVRRAERRPVPAAKKVPVQFTGTEATVLLILIDHCLSAPTAKQTKRMLGRDSDDDVRALQSAEQRLTKAAEG